MDDLRFPLPALPVRFMDQLRVHTRSKQLAYKTEKTYCHWVLRFIRFHQNAQDPTTVCRNSYPRQILLRDPASKQGSALLRVACLK